MKNKLAFITAVITALFIFCMFAGAEECDYIMDSNYKNKLHVVDHVVYELVPATEESEEYYNVLSFYDTEEASMEIKEITIRESIDGIPVKTVRTESYISGNIGYIFTAHTCVLEKITFPDSVEQLSGGLFRYMRNLKEVNLPKNLKKLESSLFAHCYNIEKITLPKGIKKIPGYCFLACQNLKEINIDNIEVLEPYAFLSCKSLNIELPKSLKKICMGALSGTAIETLRVPGGCAVESNAFSGISKLKKIIFEERTKANETNFLDKAYRAFYGCNSLEKVYFPKNEKSFNIPANMFERCENLKKIYNTANIGSIGKNAFLLCTSLESVSDFKSCTKIMENAFNGCKALKKVTGFEKLKTIEAFAFSGCEALKEFPFKQSCKSIGEYAFNGCKAMKKVVLPDNIVTVQSTAFNKLKPNKFIILSTKTDFIDDGAGRVMLKRLPKSCTVYVKTKEMKKAVSVAGFKGKIVLK